MADQKSKQHDYNEPTKPPSQNNQHPVVHFFQLDSTPKALRLPPIVLLAGDLVFKVEACRGHGRLTSHMRFLEWRRQTSCEKGGPEKLIAPMVGQALA